MDAGSVAVTVTEREKSFGRMLLSVVMSLYLLAALLDPASAYSALMKSFSVLKNIAPVLLVVLSLMALVSAYIEPQKISHYLGKKSGLKGWGIALAGGVFSHGPAYLWYPMLSDLRGRGVNEGLIVSFFYARSVKVPWLPMMASYFGIAFTVILTFYILLAAVIQGKIAEKIIPPRSTT
jgi:uncharacterized membrane protein YraQ (UPF0718 family)